MQLTVWIINLPGSSFSPHVPPHRKCAQGRGAFSGVRWPCPVCHKLRARGSTGIPNSNRATVIRGRETELHWNKFGSMGCELKGRQGNRMPLSRPGLHSLLLKATGRTPAAQRMPCCWDSSHHCTKPVRITRKSTAIPASPSPPAVTAWRLAAEPASAAPPQATQKDPLPACEEAAPGQGAVEGAPHPWES